MVKEDKGTDWFLQLVTTTVVYGVVIWFTLPPNDRMYLTLRLMQGYRKVMWNRWLKATPGWLIEALQVRGKIKVD
jgi:hypothetical protein